MSAPEIRALWSVDAGQTPGAPLGDDALTRCYARPAAPTLRVNFVTSVDGAVEVEGYSEGLSGAADKRVFGLLRKLCDGLLVGAGTLRHEGYGPVRLDAERRAWRRDAGLPECPTLVVVSGRLDLDPAARAFTEAPVRPIVLTTATAAPPPGLTDVADVIRCGEDGVDMPTALRELHARGLAHLLCEGGPQLFGTLTAAGLVDELCLTITPMLTGPGAGRITSGPHSAGPHGLRLHHALAADGDVLLLRYTRAA